MKLDWKSTKWRFKAIRRRIFHAIYRRLYQDHNEAIDNSILVVGTARSGTTWLADIIASQGVSRIMFEPFHSGLVKGFRQFNYFQYMRPDDENSQLHAFCQTVLAGQIRDPWIDRQIENIRPQFRVIKEIRANLFLKWLHDRFPQVPILFILRHPCAVVLSRMKLGWATDDDIRAFLSQPKLIEDHLADKLDIIHNARKDEEKHAIIWCVSNLVPLAQFGIDNLHLVFYENLCLHPEKELKRIFKGINREYNDSIYEIIDKPSTTSRPFSAVVTGDSRVSGWKNELSQAQINRILTVVEKFDLDFLYRGSFITEFLPLN